MGSIGGNYGSPHPSELKPFDDLEQYPKPEADQPDSALIRILDNKTVYEAIEKKLVSRLSALGFTARVEAIRRYDFSSSTASRARIQRFGLNSRAVGMKLGGNPNGKYAWFGGSKDEINGILSNGFGFRKHGLGVCLSPIDHPMESLRSATPDEDGLKHVILCRVILGKAEVIHPGSDQINPSSEEFDSGVDHLVSPQKYIVWASRMNTHILPEFVVSFRGFQKSRRPSSDWMPFSKLITVLSKYLPSDAVELIKKHHSDFKKQNITRFQLIQRVRYIAGDKLLKMIIKSYRGKMKEATKNGSCRSAMKQKDCAFLEETTYSVTRLRH